MSFPNEYVHRRVAETSAKSCDICFKLSSSVLITPDNKDFFYICPSHLKDPSFCTPKIDHAAIEARRKKELEAEVERVKKEYEEKKKRKEEKTKNAKEKDDKEEDKKDTKDEKEGKTETKGEEAKSPTAAAAEEPAEEPRVFELKSTFYQQRLTRKRQVEMAKRNRERLQDPNFFPSVPKSLP